VEDQEDDVFFLNRAFKDAGIATPLQVATNGRDAMDYLSGNGRFADRDRFPMPFLILLDLRLPQVMGLEVLKWIRAQPEFRTIIVVVLTSSGAVSDLEKAYALGANAYLVKPSNPWDLRETARKIKEFWLELNHASPLIPPGKGNSPLTKPSNRTRNLQAD
jgi:CheY-like chemotaxis protein